jgi:HAD superfamily hydrolase (TIGR01549 family)
VFDENFYPQLGLDYESVRSTINEFYEQVFPELRSLTATRPGAVELVETAFERGYRVVVATNPLFPRTAILQRLSWAGLAPETYPFALIPAYESFHFAKPNPAYLAELLAQLGWPEDPILMVGDDLNNDVVAAKRFGVPVFWISPTQQPLPESPDRPTTRGDVSELVDWIDSQSEEMMKPDFNQPSSIMAILKSTPAALNTICQDLTDWNTRPQAKEWCPAEIFCHLRDVETEVNLPRLRKVLQEDNPFLAGKDTDPWAEERKYICQNGQDALEHFTQARMETLDTLSSIAPQQWDRPARHAIFGPTNLKELTVIMTRHDRLHVRQSHQTIKSLVQ